MQVSDALANTVIAEATDTSSPSSLPTSSTVCVDTKDTAKDSGISVAVSVIKSHGTGSDCEDADMEATNEVPAGYRTLVLGVHRVIYSPPPPVSKSFLPEFGLVDRARDFARHGPSVLWLFGEIYRLDPMGSLTIVTCDLMHAITPTIGTYLSNRIFNLIETGLKTKQMDVKSIAISLAIRTAVLVMSSLVGHMQSKLESKLESRVQIHFRYLRLNAQMALLRGSTPEERDEEEHSVADRTDEWRVAGQLTGHVNTMISTFSESFLMWKMLSGNNQSNYLAPMLLASWIIRALPVLDSDLNRMWSQGYLSHIINKDYIRMHVVGRLARWPAFKDSVIGLNLGPWIMQEYQTNMARLQDTDLSDLHRLLWSMENPLRGTFGQLLDEWPTLYYIFSAMCNRSTISFANISSVQQSSTSLRWKLASIFGSDDESVSELLSKIHKLFLAVQVDSDPDELAACYPAGEALDSDGMAIDFQNVTFNYSGSKTKKPAIQDVSFSILPGQLVVVVGANGSGKTSMVKLLTRAHEPTSGLIKIDGHPASHFKRYDLREATALLSQDHVIFRGITIAEDVGLGRWTAQNRQKVMEEALHLGGANELVSKLKTGSDTVLHPARTKDLGWQITSGPLKRMHDNLEKESSVSGGEKQRLVAARTFMRMKTGNVKLVVVDEPSAAMDPAGEFELFKHLREARQGKTMIFITHRFGHLTKYADVIFCMKDGELVEKGTHAELVARKGEYFHLYNVQAQAFASDGDAQVT